MLLSGNSLILGDHDTVGGTSSDGVLACKDIEGITYMFTTDTF